MARRDDLILEYFRTLLRIRRCTRIKRGAGLSAMTLAQMEILTEVAENPQATVASLARRLGISSSAVTQAADGLVRQGMLRRVGDSRDRRIVHLALTARSSRSLSVLRDAMLSSLSEMTAPLRLTELSTLVDLHRKMAP